MTPIIMNALGFVQEDKHNCYLSDKELNAVLPFPGYSIITPPPGYAPMVAPHRLMATKLVASRSRRAPTLWLLLLPTNILGIGNLAFFRQRDAQYFAKILKGRK
jgi:splicing factor 3B subunit 1